MTDLRPSRTWCRTCRNMGRFHCLLHKTWPTPYGPGSCHYCGRPDGTTQDHIVPRSRHGLTIAWNLVWSCPPCNSRKGPDLPTCPCDRCQEAVSRWRQGERAKYTPAERRERLRRAQGVPAPVPAEPVPPDLACLSPGMRAYITMIRRKKS